MNYLIISISLIFAFSLSEDSMKLPYQILTPIWTEKELTWFAKMILRSECWECGFNSCNIFVINISSSADHVEFSDSSSNCLLPMKFYRLISDLLLQIHAHTHGEKSSQISLIKQQFYNDLPFLSPWHWDEGVQFFFLMEIVPFNQTYSSLHLGFNEIQEEEANVWDSFFIAYTDLMVRNIVKIPYGRNQGILYILLNKKGTHMCRNV
jgi:hypothetical protein